LYFVDTGLRNIIAKKFDVNLDVKLFKNYVLTELLKMGFSPKYWRTKTKTEVDFVIEKENNIIPIEVKIQADIGKIERSMRSFIETYKTKTAIVITLKGKTKINDCEIINTDIFNLEKQLN